jgi:hypothetical protein
MDVCIFDWVAEDSLFLGTKPSQKTRYGGTGNVCYAGIL